MCVYVCMPRSKKRLKRNHAQTLCRKMLKGNGSNRLPVGQNAGGFCKRRSRRERERDGERERGSNPCKRAVGYLFLCSSTHKVVDLAAQAIHTLACSHSHTYSHSHTTTSQFSVQSRQSGSLLSSLGEFKVKRPQFVFLPAWYHDSFPLLFALFWP